MLESGGIRTPLKRLPFVSVTLGVINIIVFLVCTFSGNLLYNKGEMGVWNTLFLGEYWRVFTAMFLHADINHLFNNMMLVFFLGAMLEKEVGHLSLGITYVLSGIGGNILSLIYKLHMGIPNCSIGASGAAFGMDGLLLALILFSGRKLTIVSPLQIVGVVAFSLYSGFTTPQVDNAAHVGGLLIGFLIGTIISLFIRKQNTYPGNRRE